MNGYNIELRPGMRLVEETYGSKRILYIEEDTVVPRHPRFYRGLFTTLFLIAAVIVLGLAAYYQVTDAKATPSDKVEGTTTLPLQ